MVMRELEERVEALEALVNQLFRLGEVVSVVDGKARVRVRMPDADGMTSKELPVMTSRTHKNKSYDLFDVGEQVLSLFLPGGIEQGFVLGALYSDQDEVPVSSRNKTHYAWPDGAFFEYDRKSGEMTVSTPGTVRVVSAGGVTLDADVTITKGLSVAGNIGSEADISAAGKIIDGGGNTPNHSH